MTTPDGLSTRIAVKPAAALAEAGSVPAKKRSPARTDKLITNFRIDLSTKGFALSRVDCRRMAGRLRTLGHPHGFHAPAWHMAYRVDVREIKSRRCEQPMNFLLAFAVVHCTSAKPCCPADNQRDR